MTPGLPWPWRAEPDGVYAANDVRVVPCIDLKQARQVLRDATRALFDVFGKANGLTTFHINGESIVVSCISSAAQVADAINAQSSVWTASTAGSLVNIAPVEHHHDSIKVRVTLHG